MAACLRSPFAGSVGALARVACFALIAACSGSEQDIVRANADPDPSEPPNATETNFFRLPCDEDGDCLPGEICALPDEAPPDGEPVNGRCVDDAEQ